MADLEKQVNDLDQVVTAQAKTLVLLQQQIRTNLDYLEKVDSKVENLNKDTDKGIDGIKKDIAAIKKKLKI